MDFLDNSVLPQSLGHLELLRYLFILTFSLFVPYISTVLGLLGYSLWFDKSYKTEKNLAYNYLSKRSIDFVTGNKSLSFGLGIVPLLSALFGYAQLLQNHSAIVLESVMLSLLFFVVAIIFLYKYRNDLHYKDLLKQGKDNEDEKYIIEEAQQFKKTAENSYRRQGITAIVFLLVSLLFFISAVSISSDYASLKSISNIFQLIVNVRALVNYDFLLLFSIMAGTAAFVYVRKNNINNEIETDTDDKIHVLSTRVGIISSIVSMVFVLFSLFVTPKAGLTFGLFLIFALIVLIGLSIAILYYYMVKEKTYHKANIILYLSLVFIILFVIKDNMAFATASQDQFYTLSRNYETYKKELIASLGGNTAVEISGEDIYNSKCIACHQFGQKLVGPPYNNVLPKYEGKTDQLVKFILNPQKIDPNYPDMPNQGLKPNEAKAIAEYIVSVYKGNEK